MLEKECQQIRIQLQEIDFRKKGKELEKLETKLKEIERIKRELESEKRNLIFIISNNKENKQANELRRNEAIKEKKEKEAEFLKWKEQIYSTN